MSKTFLKIRNGTSYPGLSADPSDPANGDLYYNTISNVFRQYLGGTWFDIPTGAGSGTVTDVSVVSANGLAGTVATATTTPAITLSTTVTGILQGNGTAISAATTGNLTDVGTDGIVVTGGTGAVLGSGTSLAQHVADTSHNGYLSSTDWNTFNGKQSTVSFGIFGSTPNSSGGGISGGVITLQPADATHPGGLSTGTQTIAGAKTFNNDIGSTYWSLSAATGAITLDNDTIFSNGSGTLTVPTINLGTPASTAGLLKIANGSAGGAAITVKNLGATSAYNFNLPTTAGTTGQVLTSAGGTSSSMTWGNAGSGTVTSVTFTGDGTVLSSTPSSAVTTSGTLTAALNSQSANLVFAGPSSGSAAAPTFRALVAADLPATITANYSHANTTVTGGGGDIRINFPTKIYDTGNNVTTGASWVFTAPSTGQYTFQGSVLVNNVTPNVGDRIYIAAYVNGASQFICGLFKYQTSSTISSIISFLGAVPLSSGDTLSFYANLNTSGQNPTLTGDANCYVNISLIK